VKQIKMLILVWVVMLTVVFEVVGMRSANAEMFYDRFDGAAIDESKWVVLTGPPRFHQYGGPFDPWGYWETPSGNPPYGTVSVNNSWCSLLNDYSAVFPYVVSKTNPFPEADNFTLEFRMKYDISNPHGTGFTVRYADSDNPLTNSIFSVWQDSSSTFYLTIDLFGIRWQGALSDTSEHIYTLKYTDGKYIALIDGNEIIGPITSSMRPNQIWFGNPIWAWWGWSYWTTLSVDYVRVEVMAVNVNIDIKPGSFPNAIKLQDTGNIPVAIFSTSTFDAANIDVATLELNGAGVRIVNGKGLQYSFDDVNGDGLMDLVVHFDRGTLELTVGDTSATVTGTTQDGRQIQGTDSVVVIE